MLLALYSVAEGPAATPLILQSLPPVIPPPNKAIIPQVIDAQIADPVLSNNWLPVANYRNYLLARNFGVVNRTVRLVSAPESTFGRYGDLTITLTAAGTANDSWIFGPFAMLQGWIQQDGSIYVVSSSTDIKLTPIVSA
jgi:hypothetical protein